MMRFGGSESEGTRADLRVIPFPGRDRSAKDEHGAPSPQRFAQTAEDLLQSLDSMSRKINDLARELHCLGHFDDDGDGPRAA